MSPRETVLAAPDGVLPDSVVDAAALPVECDMCGGDVTYWRDLDGVWQECECDAGYVLLV